MPLLLLLAIVGNMTTAIVAVQLLLCFYSFFGLLVLSPWSCQSCATALTATVGACYATLLLPLLLLVAFVLCHRHHHWLIVAIFGWFFDLLFLPLLICQLCRRCYFSMMLQLFLLTPPLLCCSLHHGVTTVATSCHCHCHRLIVAFVCILLVSLLPFFYLFAVVLVACDAATAWLSAPFSCAAVLLTPLLLLLVATLASLLLVASWLLQLSCGRLKPLQMLQPPPTFAVVIFATGFTTVFEGLVATCCSWCHPYRSQ